MSLWPLNHRVTVDRKQLKRMRYIVKGKQSMIHGNTDKHHIEGETEDAYKNIIETLRNCKKQSTPFATRVVTIEAGKSSPEITTIVFIFLPLFSLPLP